jgi:hypothetical protein
MKRRKKKKKKKKKANRHFMASSAAAVASFDSRTVCAVCVCVCDGMAMAGEILRWSVGSRQRVLTHADISVVYLQRSGPFQGSASSLLFLSHFISVEFLFLFCFCFFSRAKRKISERKEKRKKNKITQDRVNQTKWCLTYSLSFSG